MNPYPLSSSPFSSISAEDGGELMLNPASAISPPLFIKILTEELSIWTIPRRTKIRGASGFDSVNG